MLGEGIIVRGATGRSAALLLNAMSRLLSIVRWLLTRASAVLVVAALAGRAWRAWRRRGREDANRRRTERNPLPSVYDVHPAARTGMRRRIGLRTVPLDRIVGTMRHPTQNTADFLPLPQLRGRNWEARWQRINRATDRLEMLPPVELVQVGDDYYVADGHNRVAAARRVGAIDIDADVTQLLLPGVTQPGQATIDASSLIGTAEVRQAAAGRQSRTVEQRDALDEIPRDELLRADDERR
jgi:hypothetical protein